MTHIDRVQALSQSCSTRNSPR
ncbi:hypothetical protein AZE42_07176 [Rhizopogon vesiculosus]|uniref:Uncharacterized protein n=1 Tax=Rhizopogon vesiculosus TaxID=180088 RepID=A0A1J8QCK2_9AGAM|nr:hypothetical protein AZE42_07176 [Rhizopogon vesiculosus]